MQPMVSTLEVACPPREVFAYATDPVRFPEWQRDVTGARMLDGSRFVTSRRIRGADRPMTLEIIRNDPPFAWAARGIDGPIRPHATVTVEALDGGRRSRVTFTLAIEGHGVGVALAPLVRRQARKVAPGSYRRFREILERNRVPS
jgi:hypothetical protein